MTRWNGIDLYVVKFDKDKVYLLTGNNAQTIERPSTFEFEKMDEFAMYANKSLSLMDSEAQELMDNLYSCGIRPTEGTGSAGSMEKVEAHLQDMRRIVFKKLGMKF